MKKTITTIIIVTLILLSYFTLISFNNNPEEEIVGTWILESDTNSKWVFTSNNCYWYYNNNLEDTFTYSILDLSNSNISNVLCGFNVKSGGVEDLYLRLKDQDNKKYCYEIFGLDNETLSLNYLGQAKIKVFNKQ